MADGGDKEEIMRFWKRQSTKNKTRVGGFKYFQCRTFFGEDGIQVDEHIFPTGGS